MTLWVVIHKNGHRILSGAVIKPAICPALLRLSFLGAVALSLLILMIACSGDDSTGPDPHDPPVDSVLQVITTANADSVSLYAILRGHTEQVWTVKFSPTDQLLASCGDDRVVRLWDLDSLDEVHTLSGMSGWVIGLAYTPDGQSVVGGEAFYATVPSQIKLWNVTTGEIVRTLSGHRDAVWCLDYLSDSILVSVSRDQTLRLWNVLSGEEVGQIEAHENFIAGVSVSPDKTMIATSSTDNSVRIWDVSTLDNLHVLTGHTDDVGCISFSPDGTILASASDDGTIRLWNPTDGTLIRAIDCEQDWVNGVTFNPDGTILVSCGHDGTVKLWETGTGQLLRVLSGHTDGAIRPAFSPDGKLIATASWDHTVRLWGFEAPVE